MNLLVAILGLAVLILIHEAGHFYVARAVGMRPRKFYVGFPPALAKVRRNGIEYGIGSIPLGGYVKIPGMHRPAPSDVDLHLGRALQEEPGLLGPAERIKAALAAGDMAAARAELPALEAAVDRAELSPLAEKGARRLLTDLGDGLGDDAYWRQVTWRKVSVIFAGPAANLLLAIVLLTVAYAIGIPSATRQVDAVVPGSPAAEIGLRPGDEIVAIDGRPVEPDTISSTIRASGGRPLRVTVERDGRRVVLPAARPERSEGALRLGFRLAAGFERHGPLESIGLALESTWTATRLTGEVLARIVTGEDRDQVSSVVGITQGSSQAVEAGIRYYLPILALISLSLALLNLLPLLPLDGGHITFSIIEGIRGRALGREVYERVSLVGIAFVLLLFAIGLSNDITRLNGG
jgi:regulator of sigma E protease